MSMLQGNTYLMPIKICDADGVVIKGEQVEKGEFVFGGITKFYGGADGEVVWDESREAFILPLSEEETFGFRGVVEYQGRVLLKDGSVSGSVPKSEDVYASIGTARLSDGGAGEESGEILTIRLLDRVINTGTTEEVDPTVPAHVKEITEQDIADWNKIKSLGGVLRLKGSVQTYADLPTENNVVGDVYNVIDEHDEYGAGTNFAWTTEGTWDALGGKGGTIDLSGYISTEEYNKLLNNQTQIQINPSSHGLSIGGASAGYDGIGIGQYASAGSDGIAIGYTANGQSGGVGIGRGTKAPSNSVAIGNGAKVTNATGNSVALGAESMVQGTYATSVGISTQAQKMFATAVGAFSQAREQHSIGLGAHSYATAEKSIQIGNGTNATANTLQVFDKNIYNHDTDVLTVSNVQNSAGGFVAGLNAVSESGGIAIGENATVVKGGIGIAIGKDAKSNTVGAIQLGGGKNLKPNTLQISNDNIYNHETHTLTVQNIELNGVDINEVITNAVGGAITTALNTPV